MNEWTNVIAAAASFLTAWLLGFVVIPWLHKLKYGQTILDIGPKWHAKKQGTATMGGIMFITAVAVTFAVGMIIYGFSGADFTGGDRREFVVSLSGAVMAVFFGAVGFLDDFIKVAKKRNEGLTPIQKIILQVMIIAAYFATIYISGFARTVIAFPWGWQWDLGIFYYPIMGLGILYLVNAVNLTDVIDGLCSLVTVVYCAAFAAIAGILGMFGQSLLAFCTAGALIGFLVWNFPPAKVFMGDTGSMFLGGIVCALGVGCKAEFLMVTAGIIYVFEALSVIIQTTVFKITKKIYHTKEGKRVFKMTPIHHHFEMSGWSELKIDVVFSLITVITGALSVFLAFMMFSKQ